MIIIDKKYPECTAIDTLAWLDKTAGKQIPAWQEFLEEKDAQYKLNFDSESDWNWSGTNPYTGRYWISSDEMQRAIAEFLLRETGEHYVQACGVDNVYNHEQDFSDVFQFQVWTKAEDSHFHEKTKEWYCDEWYYRDDVFVATEIHLGGDVRGNYSTVQLRRAARDLADSQFLDWVIGWYVTTPDGENVDDDGLYSVGYHSNPTCALMDDLDDGMEWSDEHECFIGKLNGATVHLHPTCNAEYN